MSEASPWLDLVRRPQRRYLAGLSASLRPVAQSPRVVDRIDSELRRIWAERLDIAPDALLPCASTSDALRLVAHAVLLPGDRVRLAQPGQATWSAAVLAAGAHFVDLGRLYDGRVDPSTLGASAPARLALLGAPAPTGRDDVADWSAQTEELRVADASLAGTLVGRVVAGADLTLVVLRDPDRPAMPVLAGLCGAPGDIAALGALAGPSPLPMGLLRQGLNVAYRADDARSAAFASLLKARAAELETILPLGPGQTWLPRAGISRAVGCLAADGAELVAIAQQHGFSAAAWGPHPGGGLVRVNLLP